MVEHQNKNSQQCSFVSYFKKQFHSSDCVGGTRVAISKVMVSSKGIKFNKTKYKFTNGTFTK